MINIKQEFQQHFIPKQRFKYYMTFATDPVHQNQNRTTSRFYLDGQWFFIKRHQGVGWCEIFKNLFALRLPIISSKNEWRAINKVSSAGISTTPAVAYGVKGINPARKRSFLITKDLGQHISLEQLAERWQQQPPNPREKWQLITQVAELARQLHQRGVNHRDFYLCHILLDNNYSPSVIPRLDRGIHDSCNASARNGRLDSGFRLHLLDLHRAQCRRKVPKRWLIKDIGSLYFSALDAPLTKRDYLRFLQVYRQQPLRALLQEKDFWQQVQQRAVNTYRKVFNREANIPF